VATTEREADEARMSAVWSTAIVGLTMSWHLRAWFAVFLTVAAVVGLAAPALAETVRLDIRIVAGRQVSKLVYRAAPGERNDPRVSYQSPAGQISGPITDYWVTGTLPETAPGRGCALTTYLSGATNTAIRCPIPDGVSPGGAVMYLGDRNDSARGDIVPGSPALSMHVLLHGGPGNDSLSGSGRLNGGLGDDKLAGFGRLNGGGGFDLIEGSGRLIGGPGPDEITGSPERDMIDARDRAVDLVMCKAGSDTAILDGRDTGSWFNEPPDRPLRDCERLRRRGAARAAPMLVYGESTWEETWWAVYLGCPPDGADICIGDVTVSYKRRVIGHAEFRVRGGHAIYAGHRETTARFLSRLDGGRVWVRVRSYDRRGRPRVASTPIRFYVWWEEHWDS
jgi:hypothetical protein